MTFESSPLPLILVVTAALSVACAGPDGRPGGGFGGGGIPVATTTGDPAESSSAGSSSDNASAVDAPTTAGENPEFTTDADPDTGEAEPESICGDEILQDGEACDEGPDNNDAGACMTNCVQAVCGDGLVHVGVEGCDDGNLVDDDACTNLCALASCGDGVLQPGEACDDGDLDDTDACTSLCTVATCGDGVVQMGEACDDGDLDDTDACTSLCAHAMCGDAVLQAGEQCDEGPANADNAGCTGACKAAACGDGLLYEGAEECDDGAQVAGDGCTADCQIEDYAFAGYDGPAVNVPENGYTGSIDSMACVEVFVQSSGAVHGLTLGVAVSHTYVGDLVYKLIAPGGQILTVLSRPGLLEGVDDGNLVGGNAADLDGSFELWFVDGGVTDAEVMGSTLLIDGQIVCTDDSLCNYAPNPGAGPGVGLSDFLGHPAFGSWKLCVGDGANGDEGSIEGVTLTVSLK